MRRNKDDFSLIRGANYVPSYAKNDVQTWLHYDHNIIDRELGYAEKLRLNSVRIFLQYLVYEDNPQLFLERYEDFLQLCEKHHIQAMVVIFDSCFGAEPTLENGGIQTEGRGLPWVANPGPSREGKEFWTKLEKYVRDVVEPHHNDQRIVIWDIMNEPANTEKTKSFLQHFCEYVKKLNPIQPTTVCYPFGWDWVDIISIHPYISDPKEFRQAIRNAKKQDKSAVITEMGRRPTDPFEVIMPIVEEEQIGWYFWELMIGTTQFHYEVEGQIYQGVVYPDGSVYQASEIPYILGLSGEKETAP